MNILGISAFYHDSAAALVRDGEIVAAAQEERFTRRRHDAAFPARAAAWCLEEAGIGAHELDAVAFYEKPWLKAERLLESYLAVAPRGFRSFLTAIPTWLREKRDIPGLIRSELGAEYRGPVIFPEHHQSHAASAFYPSPFEDAAILTVDGVGEWATTTIGAGRENRVEILEELHFPHSLGLLYSAFTYYAGFRVNSGEYKVMGLAPYGEPRYLDLIFNHLVELREDGSFRLDQRYFNYIAGLTMTSPQFDELFGGPPRRPESLLTQRDMDLAASVQAAAEEVMLRLARRAYQLTGSPRLCLAGGVALNCVANGRILREGPFDRVWIQPASGDAGGSLGAALFAWHQLLERPREVHPSDAMRGALLGPQFSNSEIEAVLLDLKAPYRRLEDEELAETVARLLDEGLVAGWFRGRMEFGPRALGARSIIGDARSPQMQSQMNLKIKFRESFRPFAPCVLREHVSRYFELDEESPYMLLVAAVHPEQRLPANPDSENLWGIERLNRPRSSIPAVTHVDWSARIQTVDAERHGLFRTMMEAFYRQTGCPVIVNTSFNVRGEPIVCTPADAYRCFMFTDLDALILENCLLLKKDQPALAGREAHLARFGND